MSGVKERVLLIAESKGISKAVFFEDLGFSYANFKGVQKFSALSSDAMIAILTKYNDICPTWLLMGTGEMYRNSKDEERVPAGSANNRLDDNAIKMDEAMNKVINALEQTIRTQEKTIFALEKQIGFLEKE